MLAGRERVAYYAREALRHSGASEVPFSTERLDGRRRIRGGPG
jgi:hypothetical protein